jgi:hypothetical protein
MAELGDPNWHLKDWSCEANPSNTGWNLTMALALKPENIVQLVFFAAAKR